MAKKNKGDLSPPNKDEIAELTKEVDNLDGHEAVAELTSRLAEINKPPPKFTTCQELWLWLLKNRKGASIKGTKWEPCKNYYMARVGGGFSKHCFHVLSNSGQNSNIRPDITIYDLPEKTA